MDAIDFLRKEYSVTGDTMLVDVIGVNMKLDIVIRLMDKYADTKQKLNIHGVMQAEGSDGVSGAAVGQRSGDTNAEGEELLCFCANGGREGLRGVCTNCGNYVGSSREEQP